jgi:hypothetical protein
MYCKTISNGGGDPKPKIGLINIKKDEKKTLSPTEYPKCDSFFLAAMRPRICLFPAMPPWPAPAPSHTFTFFLLLRPTTKVTSSVPAGSSRSAATTKGPIRGMTPFMATMAVPQKKKGDKDAHSESSPPVTASDVGDHPSCPAPPRWGSVGGRAQRRR